VDSTVTFPVVNVGVHTLPAVVMGLVVGRVDETATFELTADHLERAIELLAPAEAATMFQHPNLTSWHAMRSELQAGRTGRIFTVFITDLATPSSSIYDDALRAQIAAGERAALRTGQ
jgi:hypothetical protein